MPNAGCLVQDALIYPFFDEKTSNILIEMLGGVK